MQHLFKLISVYCKTAILVSAALMYSGFGVLMAKLRGAEDELNTIVAGTATGMLYKSSGTAQNTSYCWTVFPFFLG